MKFDRTQMCAGCPWKKDSAQGWLGSMPPVEFVGCIQAEIPLPCHLEVDYDDPDWENQEVNHCVGALIATRKLCKLPRDPVHAEAVSNVPMVDILHPMTEFTQHHEAGTYQSWSEEEDDGFIEEQE